MSDPARAFLRHSLATLAYRGGKAVNGVSDEVAAFRASATTRSPVEILAHIGDLLDWSLELADGRRAWRDSKPLVWPAEVSRFFRGLAALDARLADDRPIVGAPERLFQGPIADALTHVGQIALLRRMAGHPVKGENYFAAEIAAGRVGPEQEAPKREFD
jgi:hypothetical protein